mmetsp:Transcript_28264/g.93805  ORF Transcript_28264/g.93805 Transcript_28264/m.93805 type:complete len:229 (-) Transcript_28264:20-706(-)
MVCYLKETAWLSWSAPTTASARMLPAEWSLRPSPSRCRSPCRLPPLLELLWQPQRQAAFPPVLHRRRGSEEVSSALCLQEAAGFWMNPPPTSTLETSSPYPQALRSWVEGRSSSSAGKSACPRSSWKEQILWSTRVPGLTCSIWIRGLCLSPSVGKCSPLLISLSGRWTLSPWELSMRILWSDRLRLIGHFVPLERKAATFCPDISAGAASLELRVQIRSCTNIICYR